MVTLTMNSLRGEKEFGTCKKDQIIMNGMEKIHAFINRGISIQSAKIAESRTPKKKGRGRPRKVVKA